MPAEFDVARDDMLGVFKTKWDADTPAVNGGAIPGVYYDGVGEAGPGPHDEAWARVQIRHNLGEVAGIGGPAGARQRTRKLGILTVQVFSPLEAGGGLTLAENLAKVAKSAFEAVVTTNGVIFRNVRAVEVGEDGPWYQINVIAEFEYDEFVG